MTKAYDNWLYKDFTYPVTEPTTKPEAKPVTETKPVTNEHDFVTWVYKIDGKYYRDIELAADFLGLSAGYLRRKYKKQLIKARMINDYTYLVTEPEAKPVTETKPEVTEEETLEMSVYIVNDIAYNDGHSAAEAAGLSYGYFKNKYKKQLIKVKRVYE